MRVDSTVTEFPGFVILPAFLTFPQCRAFEDAFFGDLNELEHSNGNKVFVSVNDEKLLPVLFLVVQEWHLEKIPEQPSIETFPSTPRGPSHELIFLLSRAIYELWKGEEVPNVSGQPRTTTPKLPRTKKANSHQRPTTISNSAISTVSE